MLSVYKPLNVDSYLKIVEDSLDLKNLKKVGKTWFEENATTEAIFTQPSLVILLCLWVPLIILLIIIISLIVHYCSVKSNTNTKCGRARLKIIEVLDKAKHELIFSFIIRAVLVAFIGVCY